MKLFLLKFYIYLLSKGIFLFKNLNYHLNTKLFLFRQGFLWLRYHMDYELTQTFIKYLSDEFYINNFLKGFDDDSINLGNLMLSKIKNITFNNILKYNDIMTKEEILQQQDFSKWMLENLKKYYFPMYEISSYLNIYYIPKLKDIVPGIEDYLQNKDIIDAGAYIGDSSISFSQSFKGISSIYSFEPVKENFEKMKYYVYKHGIKNIKLINKGVGKQNEILKIKTGGIGSKISVDGNEEIEVITIDSFVKNNNLHVGLIKWDIEGFEYNSVLGTLETIKNYKPILLISIYHQGKDFFEIKELIKNLNLGYNFKLTRWNCFHPFIDLLLVCY